jgi:hypothetical protein
MRFRKLRIAWSATCGVFCLLLISLWVQSYWWCDILEKRTASQLFQIESRTGRISVWEFNPGAGFSRPPSYLPLLLNAGSIGQFYSRRPVAFASQRPYWHQASTWAFGRFGSKTDRVVFIPFWFPALIPAACAAVPWLHWSKRFGLRTLLIATTLVAVALGLIVWFGR